MMHKKGGAHIGLVILNAKDMPGNLILKNEDE
jgi:hypothetical protein